MKLAKAGQGLPNFEKMFIKNVMVPMVRTLFTFDIAILLLKREVKIIKNLVKDIKKEDLKKRVLIDRAFGIEDNSRDFSISMVLEHLTIVGFGIKEVIKTLSLEKEFPNDIKIENVKPHANKDGSLDEFLFCMQEYILFMKTLHKKQSKSTKAHPWFVEFNNFDWVVFLYLHTFIHRRQIESIKKALR